MTVREALAFARKTLDQVPDRDVDAAWILCAVTGLSRGLLSVEGDRVLTDREEALLNAILARRATREPLQYIFGSVPFYDLELKTDKRALIPRDETALLAEEVIRLARENGWKTALDIGTGSGALALSIKHSLPDVSVTASDISTDALALAKENADRLHLNVRFVESDLFEKLAGEKFDLIVSNPPYIPTKDLETLEKELSFEPENALDGGADGLDFYRDIIAEAPAHLNNGGCLAFEIGFDQADAVSILLSKKGFDRVRVLKDYAGLDRMVLAERN